MLPRAFCILRLNSSDVGLRGGCLCIRSSDKSMPGTPPVSHPLESIAKIVEPKVLFWRLMLGLMAALAGALAKYAVFDDQRAVYLVFLPFALAAAFAGGMMAGAVAGLLSIALILSAFQSGDGVSTVVNAAGFAAGLLCLSYGATWLRSRFFRLESAAIEMMEPYAASQHLQIAINSMPIAAWDVDLRTQVLTDLGGTHRMFGLPQNCVIAESDIRALAAADDLAALDAAMRSALTAESGVYRADYRIKRADNNEMRWLHSDGQVVFEGITPVRLVGVTRDLTDERAAAQTSIERAELAERLANIAEAAPGLIFSLRIGADNKGAFPFATEKAQALFGIEAAEMMRDARLVFRRIHPDDWTYLNADMQRSAVKLQLWRRVFRFQHAEKGEIWIDAQGAPVRRKNGDMLWYGYAYDVTDRKLSELAIAEHTARLQDVIDGVRDGVFTLDAEGRIMSANDAGLEMFRFGRSEMAGFDLSRHLLLSDKDDAQSHRDLQHFPADRAIAAKGLRANGDVFPAEVIVRRAIADDGVKSILFINDLSERDRNRRRIEELTLERLSAIGAMAKILAHQINQPLTAASAYLKVAQRLLERLPPEQGAPISDTVGKAIGQTMRAGDVVRSLRELVAREEPDKTVVSVRALVEQALSLIDTLAADAGIRITKALASEDDLIVADRVQLKQVLANLLRNAIEAMRGSTRRELLISTSIRDSVISVEIADTGRGLEGIDGGRLFEPFSTSSSRGMGIGLPTSRAIIEAHYGRIWAKPNPDGGAIFGFELPLRDRDSSS